VGHDEEMPGSLQAPVRYLWLLRHGKAASDAPWGGGDRERPLTARGRRDATALGVRLADKQPMPGLKGTPRLELVICSAAVRTRQTADLIVKELGGHILFDSYRSLYQADADDMLQYVQAIDGEVRSALVVGHNPSVYQLAWDLLADQDDHDQQTASADRSRLETHGFPTCAMAVLTLEAAGWGDVTPQCGRLSGLFKPPY
jgi:phosphohistidine phosphatase